jgi:predicted RecA/RadA family phage recombinase
MRNFVQKGEAITVAAPATVVSGQGVLVGDLFGVAITAASSGALVEIQTEGVVTLPKAAGSIGAGVRVFWDNTNGNVTTTTTNNRCIGWHVGTAANAGDAGTGLLVKLGRPNAVAA